MGDNEFEIQVQLDLNNFKDEIANLENTITATAKKIREQLDFSDGKLSSNSIKSIQKMTRSITEELQSVKKAGKIDNIDMVFDNMASSIEQAVSQINKAVNEFNMSGNSLNVSNLEKSVSELENIFSSAKETVTSGAKDMIESIKQANKQANNVKEPAKNIETSEDKETKSFKTKEVVVGQLENSLQNIIISSGTFKELLSDVLNAKGDNALNAIGLMKSELREVISLMSEMNFNGASTFSKKLQEYDTLLAKFERAVKEGSDALSEYDSAKQNVQMKEKSIVLKEQSYKESEAADYYEESGEKKEDIKELEKLKGILAEKQENLNDYTSDELKILEQIYAKQTEINSIREKYEINPESTGQTKEETTFKLNLDTEDSEKAFYQLMNVIRETISTSSFDSITKDLNNTKASLFAIIEAVQNLGNAEDAAFSKKIISFIKAINSYEEAKKALEDAAKEKTNAEASGAGVENASNKYSEAVEEEKIALDTLRSSWIELSDVRDSYFNKKGIQEKESYKGKNASGEEVENGSRTASEIIEEAKSAENAASSFEKLDEEKRKVTKSNEEVKNSAEKTMVVFSSSSKIIKGAINGLKQYIKAMSSVVKTIGKFEIASAQGFAKGIKSGINGIKQLISNLKQLAKHASSSVNRLLRYTFGIRGMFTLFRKAKAAIKEGIDNLVQFDSAFGNGAKSVNQTISDMKNASKDLKNQIIAAFYPLVQIVVPMITAVIQALTAAFKMLSLFLAAITGGGKYLVATKNNENYAKSLKDVGSAANNLSGLDEIHLWDAGSGGGGQGLRPEEMFQWEEVDEEFKKLSAADWGKLVAEKINEVIDAFDPEKLSSKIVGRANWIGEFITAAIDNIKAEELGSKFAEALNKIFVGTHWEDIGHLIAAKKKLLYDTLYGLIKNLDFDALGKSIGETINGWDKYISFERIADVISTGVAGILTAAKTAIETISFETIGNDVVAGFERIADNANDYDWDSFGKSIAYAISSIPWERLLSTAFDAAEAVIGGVLDGLLSAIGNLDIKRATNLVGNGIKRILKGLTNLIKKVDWKELSRTIEGIIEDDSFWSGITDAFSTLQDTVAKAINDLVSEIDIKQIVVRIKDIAASLGFDKNRVGAVILGAFGAAITGIGGVITAFNPASGIITMAVGIAMMASGATMAMSSSNVTIPDAFWNALKVAFAGVGLMVGFATGNAAAGLIVGILGILAVSIVQTTVENNANEKQEIDKKLASIRDEVQSYANEAIEITQQVKVNLDTKIEDVEQDFSTVRTLIDQIFNINTEDGTTVTEAKTLKSLIEDVTAIIGEEDANALGLYFDNATLSVKGTNDTISELIAKLEEEAKAEAYHDILVEQYKSLAQAELDAKKAADKYTKAQTGTYKNYEQVRALRDSYYDVAGSILDMYNSSDSPEHEQAVQIMDGLVEQAENLGFSFDNSGSDLEIFNAAMVNVLGYMSGAPAEFEEMRSAVENANGAIADIKGEIGYTEAAWSTFITEISDGDAQLQTLTEHYGSARTALNEYGEEIVLYTDEAGRMYDENFDLMDSFYVLADAEGHVTEINGTLLDSQDLIIDKSGKIISANSNMEVSYKDLEKISKAKLANMSSAIIAYASQNNISIDESINKFSELKNHTDAKLEEIERILASTGIDMSSVMRDNGENILKGLVTGFLRQQGYTEEEIESIWENIGDSLKEMYGIASPSKVFADYGEFMMEGLGKGISDNSSIVGDSLKDVTKEVTAFGTDISSAVASIMNKLNSTVTSGLNSLLGRFNSFGSKLATSINRSLGNARQLKSLSSKMQSIGLPSPYASVSIPSNIYYSSVPYLATGAVIPPNAPFLAMLGDQKHGNNIETPEDLLRKIVREESGNNGSGNTYQFTAQLNRKTVFDQVIEEAQMRQIRTGKNPFELG